MLRRTSDSDDRSELLDKLPTAAGFHGGLSAPGPTRRATT